MMTEYVFSVLITFLTRTWGLKLLIALVVTNLQDGLVGISQIFVAYVADSCVGNFWLLFFATIAYCIGLGLLSYCHPKFNFDKLPNCVLNKECPPLPLEVPFFVALALITIGQSGTRFSLEEFIRRIRDGTNQQAEWKEKKFICLSWIILSVFGSLIGSFALPSAPIKRKTVLQICAYAMAGSFFIYWLGILFYPPDRPQRSPLSSVPRVTISAFRNRHRSYDEVEKPNVTQNVSNEAHTTHLRDGENANPEDENTSSHETDAVHEPQNPVVLSAGTLRCLNKAADDCSPQKIEATKHFIRMLPISTTLLMCGIVNSMGKTFFLEEGYPMDSTIGSIENFPLQGFLLLSIAVEKATSKIYDLITKRRTSSTNRMSDAIKIGIGLVMSIICCINAAAVETKRLRVIRDKGLLKQSNYTVPLSVFRLTPQFVLLGTMNGLSKSGIKGFFGYQAPMKRYGSALVEGVYGSGTILSLGMIFAMRKVTGRKHGWFADSIDSCHLDHFCHALAVVAAINIIFYYMVAKIFLQRRHG